MKAREWKLIATYPVNSIIDGPNLESGETVSVREVLNPDPRDEAIRVMREALGSIASSHTTCWDCDGGEHKRDEAEDAIARVDELLGV